MAAHSEANPLSFKIVGKNIEAEFDKTDLECTLETQTSTATVRTDFESGLLTGLMAAIHELYADEEIATDLDGQKDEGTVQYEVLGYNPESSDFGAELTVKTAYAKLLQKGLTKLHENVLGESFKNIVDALAAVAKNKLGENLAFDCHFKLYCNQPKPMGGTHGSSWHQDGMLEGGTDYTLLYYCNDLPVDGSGGGGFHMRPKRPSDGPLRVGDGNSVPVDFDEDYVRLPASTGHLYMLHNGAWFHRGEALNYVAKGADRKFKLLITIWPIQTGGPPSHAAPAAHAACEWCGSSDPKSKCKECDRKGCRQCIDRRECDQGPGHLDKGDFKDWCAYWADQKKKKVVTGRGIGKPLGPTPSLHAPPAPSKVDLRLSGELCRSGELPVPPGREDELQAHLVRVTQHLRLHHGSEDIALVHTFTDSEWELLGIPVGIRARLRAM